MTIIEWQILLSWEYFHDWKKKWLRRSVQEPCVLLKDTTNTAENHHPHQLNEAPVVASGIDGGKEGEREEKKKRSWRWPSPRIPRRIAAKYKLSEAEKKYQVQAGSYRTFTDGTTTSTCPVLTLGLFFFLFKWIIMVPKHCCHHHTHITEIKLKFLTRAWSEIIFIRYHYQTGQ